MLAGMLSIFAASLGGDKAMDVDEVDCVEALETMQCIPNHMWEPMSG